MRDVELPRHLSADVLAADSHSTINASALQIFANRLKAAAQC